MLPDQVIEIFNSYGPEEVERGHSEGTNQGSPLAYDPGGGSIMQIRCRERECSFSERESHNHRQVGLSKSRVKRLLV